jgi:hypothetical protein
MSTSLLIQLVLWLGAFALIVLAAVETLKNWR